MSQAVLVSRQEQKHTSILSVTDPLPSNYFHVRPEHFSNLDFESALLAVLRGVPVKYRTHLGENEPWFNEDVPRVTVTLSPLGYSLVQIIQ